MAIQLESVLVSEIDYAIFSLLSDNKQTRIDSGCKSYVCGNYWWGNEYTKENPNMTNAVVAVGEIVRPTITYCNAQNNDVTRTRYIKQLIG